MKQKSRIREKINLWMCEDSSIDSKIYERINLFFLSKIKSHVTATATDPHYANFPAMHIAQYYFLINVN